MKKIGLLTFHNENNFGAILQTFALQKYIQLLDNKNDVGVIDYRSYMELHRRRISSRLGRFYRFLKSPLPIVDKKKFLRFRETFLHFSGKRYVGDKDFLKTPPLEFDTLLVGSDQVWNLELTGNSKGYYLPFQTNAKKISYASSFGRSELTNAEREAIREYLPSFSAVSSREQSGVDAIKREINKDVSLCLDPVYLLEADEWKKLTSKNLELPKTYVFVYVMETTELLKSLLDAVQRKYRLPVIAVWGWGKVQNWGKVDRSCGPEEFLKYIESATYVVTNSFHGLSFSLIFKKKVFCAAHTTRNTRLENVLSLAGVQQKQYVENAPINDVEDYLIDGATAFENLLPYVVSSKDYLKKALDA